jgi:succinylglutamate desuccinylase
LSITDVVDKVHAEDHFSRAWTSFDRFEAGELIGTRHDGEALVAEQAGWILFPNAVAAARQEWFYTALANPRF